MDELTKLVLVKSLTKFIPQKGRHRLSRILYNYDSIQINGIDLIVNYDDNLKLLLNTKEFIGWNIFFHNYYEKETNLILKKYIKPDFIVIEAGANNGSETIIIGNILRKGNGKVYAFEPAPLPLKYLQINIILSDLDKTIEVYDLLLGEKVANVEFFLKSNIEANQGQSSKYKFNEATKMIIKKQISLDKFIEEKKIERVDFIKMDIQGSELDFIEGGINTINKFQPIIFTEASNAELSRCGKSIIDLYERLLSLNYNVYSLEKNEKLRLLIPPKLEEGNWLAVPKKI